MGRNLGTPAPLDPTAWRRAVVPFRHIKKSGLGEQMAIRSGVISRALVFAASLAVSVSWSSPDDPVDSYDRLVNTDSAGEQAAPAVARDADGDFVVVWESDNDGADYDV